MPITKSAKKALKQTKRRTAQNKLWKQKLKDAIRKAEAAFSAGEKQKIKEAVSYAFKITDKASKVRIVHKNKAARIKSALSRLLK
ncbi:MAG: 30S ribosomal protein S20 [Patescibacteria group bacterium]